MRELRREIDIDAPPAAVWAVLTDTRSYSEWNPFMPHLAGELRDRCGRLQWPRRGRLIWPHPPSGFRLFLLYRICRQRAVNLFVLGVACCGRARA
jgi:Polyketide cyclase / dehydrase and lipid transport